MKKAVFFLLITFALGLVGFRVYDAYKTQAATSTQGVAGAPSKGGGADGRSAMGFPLVDAVMATEGSFDERISLIGSLRPIAEVSVMSKVAGRVEKVMVDVGDHVSEGQLLAQVEDRELLQQVQQAEASLAVARASIRQREAELANYTRQVERYRGLFEQNLLARQDLEDVITRQQTSQAQLELSKAQYRQSEATVNQFKINLENTRSYSPMAGFVSKRFIHPGALVDLRTLRMVVNAVEKDIVHVNRGSNVEVTVDAYPGKAFAGIVQRVSPVLDPATRTGEVEIYVPNHPFVLRAEMFARVSLFLGSERKGILVPRDAVVYRGEESGVFILDGSNARFRPVRVGTIRQNQVEIVDGVKLGETVISMGASLLKDGDQVRLKSANPMPKAPSDGSRPPLS
jgi:RND family efflux transporter MFP subunit